MVEEGFLRGETWGMPGAPVEHIETHAAHVFLAGDKAFKIKKPVKLPYLDFTTRDKRRAVLAHEFEINRRFAPDIYRGLSDVRGEPVLVMNRFAAGDVLADMVEHGRLPDALANDLARMAAVMHDSVAAATAGGAAIMAGLGAQLSAAFTGSPDIFPAAATLEFHALYEEALHRHAGLLNRRAQQGQVRRCHGDLHCGNIVLLHGKPVPFDAIEFSEAIATIDVLYDLAFLLMDLWYHGEHRAANLVLNRYVDLRRAYEDGSGLALLPLFLATRAGVRALVAADRLRGASVAKSLRERGAALDYFRACIAYLKPPPPVLVCIGGLSGSGKSALAASLAPGVGAAPGALHLRSDIERKRLAGVNDVERLPAAHYTKEASREVYDALQGRAALALRAGHSVVVDAVFAEAAERNRAEEVARQCHARFAGVWLEAPAAILKARVSARRGDVSDANAAVVERQLGTTRGHIGWTHIDASGSQTETLAAVKQRLALQSAGPA